MTSMFVPLRLRAATQGRQVTWLELFFDLVFVAAVAQVASPLHGDYSPSGLVRLAPLFALVWWAWTGHSVYSTRFDTDDGLQRALTLLQMFAVTVMAANAGDALDSVSAAGFVAAYAVVRLVLVAQYARARQVRRARAIATHYAAGHGAAAVLWLLSAVVPVPARFLIWAAALAIDLGTPWLGVHHNIRVPPDARHLPERFGLFTLILLGESVVSLMRGVESQESWPLQAFLSAVSGMVLLFAVWWVYFDGIGAVEHQHVRTRRDAVRFHVWSYAHLPLALGIVVLGVGIERTVTAAARASLPRMDVLIMAGAAALIAGALGVIAATSGRHARRALAPAGAPDPTRPAVSVPRTAQES